MLFWALTFLAVVPASRASPVQNVRSASCTSPTLRTSWHTLTSDEKESYVTAEKCLMSLPAKLGLVDALTRFDEFQMMHVMVTPTVHGVGAFLPFHRYYVHAHEVALRTECNYTGSLPYWEEWRDAGNFINSEILDPVTGFGGNGTGEQNCVADGPFKDYVNVIGPGESNTKHCIDRMVNDCQSKGAAKIYVDQCMAKTTWLDAWNCIEGMPHSSGHGGIGGEMFNVFSSPGDPLFYLHHAYIDKLWYDWQQQDLTVRLKAMGGSNQPVFFPFPPFNGTFPIPGNGTNGTLPGFPGPFPGIGNGSCVPSGGLFPPPSSTVSTNFAQVNGDPGNETTLGHVLTVHGYLPDVTIADVMDTKGGLLCYDYA